MKFQTKKNYQLFDFITGNFLFDIAVILIITWELAFAFYVAFGFIHIVPAVAIILFNIKLVGGNKAV